MSKKGTGRSVADFDNSVNMSCLVVIFSLASAALDKKFIRRDTRQTTPWLSTSCIYCFISCSPLLQDNQGLRGKNGLYSRFYSFMKTVDIHNGFYCLRKIELCIKFHRSVIHAVTFIRNIFIFMQVIHRLLTSSANGLPLLISLVSPTRSWAANGRVDDTGNRGK